MYSTPVGSNVINAIVEQTCDAIFVKDLAGRYLMINAAGAGFFGLQPHEVIGKMNHELLDPSTALKIAQEELHVMTQKKTMNFDLKLTLKGNVRVMSATRGIVRDAQGEVIGVFGIIRDVTDISRHEEQRLELYREQAARLEAETSLKRSALLAEAMSVLVSTLDYNKILQNLAQLAVDYLADWCVIDVSNDAGVIERKAVASKRSSHANHADGLNEFFKLVKEVGHPLFEALEKGKVTFLPQISEDQLKAYNLTACQSLMVLPFRLRSGLTGAVSFAASTPYRYGPGDLALAESLVMRATMAIENAMLYDEAQKAISVRDEFLSIASHELRTPLTPLKVQTQLLKRLIERDLLITMPRSEQMMILDTADREINRLSKLITNLLSVSRIASGRNQPEFEPIHFVKLLTDLVARLKDEIHAASVEIRWDIDVRDPMVRWDPLQIEQVMANLLINALKYGCGKPITLRASDLDDRIKIEVADQGMGIASSELGRIFERFERTDAARKFTGLGLGLYIARQLLLAHNGTISVTSEIGKGSTFTVNIPR